MDGLFRRDGGLDGVEEADELLMPVALHAAAHNLAFQHVEGQHNGMGGRVDVETDVFELLGELRNFGSLQSLKARVRWGRKPCAFRKRRREAHLPGLKRSGENGDLDEGRDPHMSTFDHTHDPRPIVVRRLEVITGVGGRRKWSADAKAEIMLGALAPGTTPA